ncbi:MAG TPA: SCO1664 family protein [Mycobacteriales bacterium]|nr:SCO1664 family protein [Mycobacteriales bacterium]
MEEPVPSRPPGDGPHGLAADVETSLAVLRGGRLEVEGRLVDASNLTLYCELTDGAFSSACVYKPIRGERPLWDFPDGTLAEREVAAFVVSAATGWDVVPPTVLRDGPFGPGMVQLWVDGDDTIDLLELAQSDHAALRRMAVFDAVVNNADRKGGHLIPTRDGHVFGVDHGICFSTEDKLRTLLWQWAGDGLTDEAIDMLSRLRAELEGPLGESLGELLTRREVATTIRRVDALLRTRRHPEPSGDWPAMPWPPF